MTRHFVLVNFIPIVFGIFYLIYIIAWNRDNREAFETFILTRQVNFAADSAIEELIARAPDVNLDYTSTNKTIDPTIAVMEFETTLCQELGLADTYENRDFVAHNYIKALQVCLNNGFHTYSNMVYNEKGATEFYSTPKIPYVGSLQSADGSNGMYAFVLSKDHIYKVKENVSGSTTIADIVEEVDKSSLASNTDRRITELINLNVSKYMQRALVQAYGTQHATSIEIPDVPSKISGSMPVKGPTILAVVDTSGMYIGVEAIAFGIGGAQVVEKDPVIGYISPLTGSKVWATQSAAKSVYGSSPPSGVTLFDTEYDAALAGYREDWKAMEIK